MTDYGLGRRPAPDERDHAYPMALAVPRTTTRTRRYWNASGWWGDQGRKPQCVGYAWTHWLEDGPVTHDAPVPIVDPGWLYREAQLVDEWPGEDYDGTSVRAGAKVLQAKGLVGNYLWAESLRDVELALLESGPVVVGTAWYESMFEPDRSGRISIGGGVVGGHAYLLDGVNSARRSIRLKNSWGRTWGRRGFATLSFDDLARLLAEDGEACLATELRTA